MTMNLTPTEIAWIENNPKKCANCNHLDIFHTFNDYGEFCDVIECGCKDREFEDARLLRENEGKLQKLKNQIEYYAKDISAIEEEIKKITERIQNKKQN